MTTSRAGSLSLVGGVLALDFANTTSGRDTDEPVEHLQSAGHVVDWALHAGGIDAATAARFHTFIANEPAAAQRLLRHVHQLRAAIYDIAAAIARGEAPSRTDLGTLRDFAHKVIGPAELAPIPGGGYGFDFSAAPVEVALLGPVVWSALDLLATGDFARIKQCPGEGCGWLFVDRSKNNSRRWCDMATCGNRTKGRRHRQRR